MKMRARRRQLARRLFSVQARIRAIIASPAYQALIQSARMPGKTSAIAALFRARYLEPAWVTSSRPASAWPTPWPR